MTERLKQIWSGFEGVTSRRLTNRDIENINVPRRFDEKTENAEHLSEELTAPAAAAFEALKAQLKGHGKKAGKKNKNTLDGLDADDTAQDWSAAPKPAQEMIRGLKSTEARVRRSDADYVAYLEAGGNLKKKKRFLGLF